MDVVMKHKTRHKTCTNYCEQQRGRISIQRADVCYVISQEGCNHRINYSSVMSNVVKEIELNFQPITALPGSFALKTFNVCMKNTLLITGVKFSLADFRFNK